MRTAATTLMFAIFVSGIAATRGNDRADASAANSRAATIAPNDNRRAAGALTGSVLTVHLEARAGVWQPDGPRGPSIRTFAFAEAGKTLQTPGPLLHVPLGTEVRASIHNALPKKMWVFGMNSAPGVGGDSVAVDAGATRELRFKTSVSGTFYYLARTDSFPVFARLSEDSQLGGVIVVDPAGTRPNSGERIFAITSWFTFDPKTVSGLGPNETLVFNGRAYPGNERLQMSQGDSAHWRFVNISALDHPLHLHGFYFRVDAKGDGKRDTLYSAADQRMAVTEYLLPMQTMSMSFSPNRSGNWIFHCHFAAHIAPREALEADRTAMAMPAAHAEHSTEAEANHMTGLVLGITVKPVGPAAVLAEPTRAIRLLVRSKKNVYGKYLGYSFVLGGSPEEKDPSVMKSPGPLLDLVRGERVAITVVNQSHESAAVHWHGIELESYPDGVPGVSGEGKNILPHIRPGDSITVRFTPPRSGTFMYHSHSNEFQQISSGLYGALIVRDRGAARDAENDRVLLISDAGPLINVIDPAQFQPALLNGERTPAPIEIRSGAPARLRLINIRSDLPMSVSLLEGDKAVEWRMVAKDGMPATASQSRTTPASLVIAPGETYDFEISPRAGAELTLKYELPGLPPEISQTKLIPIRVR